MLRCIELAKNGHGNVAPNPMVGCVIVHKDTIIGEGYHVRCGEAHAEVNAIHAVENKELLKEATLYVNLEPCSHHGKTPPCADLIIKNKIPRVVIGNEDTNPEVGGEGVEKLRKAGIDVKTGILEDRCWQLNRRFFTFHEKKRPYIILKWAQSVNGFMDNKRRNKDQSALQISGKEAKMLVHQWRSEEAAIMVGTNTALMDNPRLTVREVEGENPLRIVLDKDLRLPLSLFLFDGTVPTVVFTQQHKEKKENLDFVQIDFSVDVLPQVLSELYQRDVQSVFVEGGSQLLQSLLEEELWDEARVFQSPKIIQDGVSAPDIPGGTVCMDRVGDDELFKIERL